MTINDTAKLMTSADYKDRFVAEYAQTAIRYKKLQNMVKAWDKGDLNFTPTCPRDMYDRQLQHMGEYLGVLRQRAVLEHVDLPEIDV